MMVPARYAAIILRRAVIIPAAGAGDPGSGGHF